MPTASTTRNTSDTGANPAGAAEVVIHLEPPHGAASATSSLNTVPEFRRAPCAERALPDARPCVSPNHSAGAGSAASATLFGEARL